MSTRQTLIEKLTTALEPDYLDVIDESHLHHGHAGWREGGETHFRVRIAARHFDGLSRLAQHRRVMDIVADQLTPDGVHALAIEVVPPEGPVKPQVAQS